jgi:hypothetical protein
VGLLEQQAQVVVNWIGLIKAIVDFLDSLFTARNNRKHEELGRLQEAQRNAELENAVFDRVRDADPASVPDDQAFGDSGGAEPVPGPKP